MYPDDMAPPGYQIFPGSVPEFRLIQKADGTIEQHVRYVRPEFDYTGKWMKVELLKEKENDSAGGSST